MYQVINDLAVWNFLIKQAQDYRADHTMEETFWMLDCKVLGAASVWIQSYGKNPRWTIQQIKENKSPGSILEEAYHILVRRKALKPLKDCEEEFRKDLIKLTEELFGKTEQRIFYKYAKALYIFSSVPIEIKTP